MSKKIVQQLISLRKPVPKLSHLHPKALKRRIQLTETVPSLSFKLQELPSKPDLFQEDIPLGVKEILPFSISRTSNGNLPVYRDYKFDRDQKKTIIRKVSGDIEVFANELKKVTSNSDVIIKAGKIEVHGLHKDSISLWLRRLGF